MHDCGTKIFFITVQLTQRMMGATHEWVFFPEPLRRLRMNKNYTRVE
jgi:hypothetical protein